MTTTRPASLLDQANALAADCIPWRFGLAAGARRKHVEVLVAGTWHPVPEGTWAVATWARSLRPTV